MTNVRNRRALRACAALLCGLGVTGCASSDEGGTDPAQSLGDGGTSDGGLSPGGGRVGPDGAVQSRARPDEDCARARSADSAYWICDAPLKPTMAHGYCWAAGGTLAIIDDAAENEFIAGELIEPEYTIGYSDAAGEGAWAWSDGTPSGYENWGDEQPGLDDFAFIERESGAWFTTTDDARPYVCEDWK